jgi:hypothetical protein
LIDDLEGRLPQSKRAEPGNSAAHKQAWEQASKAMGERRLEEAYQLCRKLLKECPDHQDASELYKELEERRGRAGEFLATVKQGLGKQGLDELNALLAEADEAYPGHPARNAVRATLDSRAQEYAQAISECIAAMDKHMPNGAYSFLQAAKLLYPGCCEKERRANLLDTVVERTLADYNACERARRNGDDKEARAIRDESFQYWYEMRQGL